MNPLRISSCTLNGISDFFGLVRFCLVYNFHLKRGFFPLSSLRGNQIIWRGKSLAEGGLIISIAFYSVSGILWHCKGMAKLIGVAIWESLQYIKKIVSGKIALQSAFYSDRQWSGRIPISFSSSFSLHRTRRVKGGFHIWSPQKFWSFWPPPLSLRKLFILSVHKFGVFFDPLPLLCGRHMEAPKEGNTKIGGRKRLTEAENKTVSPAAPPNAQSNSDPLFKSFRCPCGIFEYVVFSRINLWNRGRNNEHQIFFEYCCISCTFLNLHSMRKHHPSILICAWFLFLCVPVPAYWGVGWAIFSKCRFLEDSAPQMWPDVTRCDQMWSDVTTLRNPRYLRSVALPTLLAHLPSLLPPPSEISLRQQRTDPACGPHFQWVWAGQGWGSLAAFTYLFRGVNTSKNLLGKNSFVKKFA